MTRKLENFKDLSLLKDDGVKEGKDIDYKLELPKDNDESKKEFLADVSSFANTIGGYLVFGIKESEGLIEELVGLKIEDDDKLLLKLESIIRDGISPRIKFETKI